MKVRILEPAKADLINGFHFYEDQEPGAGRYFLNNLYSDIEGLATTYGIHRQPFGDFHRAISKKFPYAIFYSVREYEIWVEAVIDCRKNLLGSALKLGNWRKMMHQLLPMTKQFEVARLPFRMHPRGGKPPYIHGRQGR